MKIKKLFIVLLLSVVLISLALFVKSYASNNNIPSVMSFREELPEDFVPTKTIDELNQEYAELVTIHPITQEEREELWEREYELKQEMIDTANYYKENNVELDYTFEDVKASIESRQAAYSVVMGMLEKENNTEDIQKYEDMYEDAEEYLTMIENIETNQANESQVMMVNSTSTVTPESLYESFKSNESTYFNN